MSTRERWIVYPLLFMTLGIAMRDKVIPPNHLGNLGMQFEAGAIVTPQVRCDELRVGRVVCGRLESEQVEARQSECRALLVKGPNNQPVVVAGTDSNTQAGIVETFAASGLRQVQLHSSESGGMVTTVERAGKLVLILATRAESSAFLPSCPAWAR